MRLSYSSIETYKNCPLKYKFREIDKISEPKGKEAVFGTLIHATMKYIHDPGIVSPTVEQALDYFSRHWNEEIWDNESEERSAFAQGVSMIQKYYERNRPEEATIVDLESRFSLEMCTYEGETHVISGVIDRIDKTREGYEIIDYKTSRKMPSQEKIDQDLQLSIYLKAFLHRYPKERERLGQITVSLYYLKHGVKLSSTRTQEQLDQLDETVLSIIENIEKGRFDPILSPLCDWCGYQNICPLWKHKFSETRKVDSAEVQDAIKEFLALRSQVSADKLRLAEVQELILQYMAQEEVERVFGSDGIIGKSYRKTFQYDETKLKEILEPLDRWNDILKVDGVALRQLLPLLPPEAREAVEASKSLSKESISLSVKKMNADEDVDSDTAQ